MKLHNIHGLFIHSAVMLILKCGASVSLYNLDHCIYNVYTIEAKCWFRFLLDLKYVAGAGAWTDFLGAGASGEVSRAWDGFQQITKFSPHNDTGAIATWTRQCLVTKTCLLSNQSTKLSASLFIFPPGDLVIDVSDDQRKVIAGNGCNCSGLAPRSPPTMPGVTGLYRHWPLMTEDLLTPPPPPPLTSASGQPLLVTMELRGGQVIPAWPANASSWQCTTQNSEMANMRWDFWKIFKNSLLCDFYFFGSWRASFSLY